MPRQRLADRTVLALACSAYLPLVFLGYGSDSDSYTVVGVARGLLAEHEYHASRAPGFPAHELATALLLPFGGSIATNLGSLALSLIGLWALLRISAAADVPHRDLAALLVASNPYYWINSASTIDYVWALAFCLTGLYAWMRGRPWLAGALFGLAAGARITSLVVPGAAILASLVPHREESPLSARQAPAVILALTVVTVGLYALPFAAAGYSLSFLKPPGGRLLAYYVPPWGWQGHAARWLYKNVYLFGLPAAAALLARVCLVAARRHDVGRWPWIVVVSVFSIAGCEAAFWIAPVERAYLLPILPFAAIIMATVGSTGTRPWLWTTIALQLIYAVVNVELLEPDRVHAATTATLRPSLQRGIVVSDVADRLQAGRTAR